MLKPRPLTVTLTATIATLLCSLGCQSDPKSGGERREMQAEIQTMRQQTLERLFAAQPAARTAVQNAAGDAVFSNFGLKILVAGGGSGEGVAVDHRTGVPVYMKMAEVSAGLGMGVKQFRLVWVFETQQALSDFINKGWTLGGQATAAAKAGDAGASFAGAVAVAPGVWVYQLTDSGLALELTAKGT